MNNSYLNTVKKFVQTHNGMSGLAVVALFALLIGGVFAIDFGTPGSQMATVVGTDDTKGPEEATPATEIHNDTPSSGVAMADTSDMSDMNSAVSGGEQPSGVFEDGVLSKKTTPAQKSDTQSVTTSSNSDTPVLPGGAGASEVGVGGGTDQSITNGDVLVAASRRTTKKASRMVPGGSGSVTLPIISPVLAKDTTAPTASFVGLSDGEKVEGSAIVRVKAVDPQVSGALTSGVASVTLLIDGATQGAGTASITQDEYTFTVDTSLLSAGGHVLSAKATDVAGNVGATVQVSVVVPEVLVNDTTAPMVELISVLPGATVSGSIALTASSTDPAVAGAHTSGVASVTFLIDGAVATTVSEQVAPGTYTAPFDTSSLVDGEHDIAVTARDVAGNASVEVKVRATVKNTVVPPAVPSPFTLGGVSLTFDDANVSQYQYVFPLLQQYAQTATLYVPTGLIDTDGYMSWGQVGEMEAGGWDIGGHTVTHAELPLLTDTQQEQEVAGSLVALEDKGFMSTSFATPFGAYDPETIAIIAQSYDSHRNFHHVDYNVWPYNKYFLQIERVTNTTTPADVKAWVDYAKANDVWLIIVMHEVNPAGTSGDEWSWTTDNLKEVLEYLKTSGIKTRTVTDMLKHGDNMVTNWTFEQGLVAGWRTDNPAQVTIDTASHGAYPEARTAVKFESLADASTTRAHLFGPEIAINPADLYGIRFFVNTKDFAGGELGFYIDEYDDDGNWISGKWLGKAGNNWVIDESYAYTATSLNVKKISLQVYTTAGYTGTAYIDSVEFFKP